MFYKHDVEVYQKGRGGDKGASQEASAGVVYYILTTQQPSFCQLVLPLPQRP